MRRATLFGVSLIVAVSAGAGAQAALKKYRLKALSLAQNEQTSPPVLAVGASGTPEAPFDVSFVDDSTPGSPILKGLKFKSNDTITVDVPQIAGPGSTIFISNNFLEGNGPLRKPNTFTGTGHTAGGSTVRWGIVTGWTVTGQQYCASSPPVICSLAGLEHESTTDPMFLSDFYDLGTWIFHATGFTATPFVHRYSTTNPGNNQRWIRGFQLTDATVPALPLLAVALMGVSVVVGGLGALRRKRRP